MFKRFTFLLSLVVIASLSIMAVTNLWQGSNYLEGNEMEVANTNDNLSNLTVGQDKITISFTNTEEGELKVTVNTENGEKIIYEDYHVAKEAGSATFTVTQDFIDGITKEDKFKIMAKKLTITSVDLNKEEGGDTPDPVDPVDPDPAEGTDYELELPIPETTIDSWCDVAANNGSNGKTVVYVKPGYMPGVQEGDEVWAYFTNNGGGQANFVFKGSDENWVKVGENGSTDPSSDWINVVETGKKYIFTVQAGWAEALAKNGLYIDGQNVTVNKVVFFAKNRETKPEIDDSGDEPNPEQPVTENVISLWNTGETITSAKGEATEIVFDQTWLSRYNRAEGEADALDQAYFIPAEKFAQAGYEDDIRITFTSFDSQTSDCSLYMKDYNFDKNNEWLKRGDGTSVPFVKGSNLDWFDVTSSVHTRNINSFRMLDALRANGLYIDGTNATISKIELISHDSEALTVDHPHFTGNAVEATEETQRGYEFDADNCGFNWDDNKRIAPEAFEGYENGEVITFMFNITGDAPQLIMKYILPSASSFKNIMSIGLQTEDRDGSLIDEFPDNKIIYRPTESEIASFKKNGLFMTGQNLELAAIYFGHEPTPLYTKATVLHNNWMTLGHDSGKLYDGEVYYSDEVRIYIPATPFKEAMDADQENEFKEDGCILSANIPFCGDDIDKDANGYIKFTCDPNNYGNTKYDPISYYMAVASNFTSTETGNQTIRKAEGDTEAGDTEAPSVVEFTKEIGKGQHIFPDIKISADEYQNLALYGVWVTGKNIDLQNIYLRSPKSTTISGVENIETAIIDTAIDFNEPYEAYTIDGRRVADVEAPGLYIVRQGNKVQKILRK